MAGMLCGSEGQYTCSSGTVCFTSLGIAGCAPGGGTGGGGFHSYCDPDLSSGQISCGPVPLAAGTRDPDLSSDPISCPPVPLPTGSCIPDISSGQIACGPVCCNDTEYCVYKGQCLRLSGPGEASISDNTRSSTSQFTIPTATWSSVSPTSHGTTGTVEGPSAAPSTTSSSLLLKESSDATSDGSKGLDSRTRGRRSRWSPAHSNDVLVDLHRSEEGARPIWAISGSDSFRKA